MSPALNKPQSLPLPHTCSALPPSIIIQGHKYPWQRPPGPDNHFKSNHFILVDQLTLHMPAPISVKLLNAQRGGLSNRLLTVRLAKGRFYCYIETVKKEADVCKKLTGRTQMQGAGSNKDHNWGKHLMKRDSKTYTYLEGAKQRQSK